MEMTHIQIADKRWKVIGWRTPPCDKLTYYRGNFLTQIYLFTVYYTE